MKKIIVRVLSISVVLFLFLGGGTYLHTYAKSHVRFFFSDAELTAKKGIPQVLCAVRSTVAVDGMLTKPVVLFRSRLIIKKKAAVSAPIFAWSSTVSVEKKGKLLADMTGMDSEVLVAKGGVHKGKVKKYVGRSFRVERAVDLSFINDQRIVRVIHKFRLISFAGLFLCSLMYMFFSRQFLRVAFTVYARPVWSLFSMLFGLLAFAVLGLSIVTSSLGLPGLLILVLPLTVSFIEGYTAVAIVIGKFVRKHIHVPVDKVWFEIVLGLMVLWALTFIPHIGGPLFMAAALFGAGAALFSLFGFREV